ncbi:BTAD domain-containing putative transcriptional regulator [Streptomyces sp. PR69]|uniref:BTAD domain-containing putative transcriptional regulator n=1 Tax=Streptomyces sp. PR69 TaxID=2984950 RepID=UPI0022656B27|nr:BTAD domain-containing putative transcriptional regulator [Streptomyces sp. PR69]
MHYLVLGPTQALHDDGTPVTLGGARLRALLAALALRPGRAVPVGVLVDEVWDGEPPADAVGAVQALVGRLRRALGRAAVASAEGGGYRLCAERDAVDLHRFDRLAGEGSRALADGDAVKAAALLDEALTLWRGPVLADLPGRLAEAARWETRRLDARRSRLTALLALGGRAEEALAELAELCAAHPLDERLQELRLRALRDAGRTAQALAAYEEVRGTLADRLGTDPGPGLRALHEELLRPYPYETPGGSAAGPGPGVGPAGGPEGMTWADAVGTASARAGEAGHTPRHGHGHGHGYGHGHAPPVDSTASTADATAPETGRLAQSGPAGPAVVPPLTGTAGGVADRSAVPGTPPPGNLRARLNSFVGREPELRAIGQDLARTRLVTLVGAGGAGKTRLSQEAAERAAAAGPDQPWPDGVWLAELAPVDGPESVPEAVLSALGARETVLWGAGADELRAGGERQSGDAFVRLAEHCARRRMLLLLDNCEHVIDAAAALAERLLQRCPGLTVLATSREPLGVPGELVRPVDPLPDPMALRLLAERGAAARPGFRIDADEATNAAAAEICRRLDGLPLAIELAAARLRMLTARQIADRLDDRFRLLTNGARTVLPRQQTLRAVVDWSWDLLDAPERAVLRRLSVFAGGCDLSAAESVCRDTARDDRLPGAGQPAGGQPREERAPYGNAEHRPDGCDDVDRADLTGPPSGIRPADSPGPAADPTHACRAGGAGLAHPSRTAGPSSAGRPAEAPGPAGGATRARPGADADLASPSGSRPAEAPVAECPGSTGDVAAGPARPGAYDGPSGPQRPAVHGRGPDPERSGAATAAGARAAAPVHSGWHAVPDGPGVREADVAGVLGALVDKSLVVAVPGSDGEMRYRLLETVAEYAGERLDEAGERVAAERRHLVHYRELARTLDPRLRGGGQRAALDRLQLEHENLRTALRHAVAARDEHEGLSLVLSLAWYWQLRDLRSDARHWTDAVSALGPDPFAPPVVPAPPLTERCTDAPPPLRPELLAEARRQIRLVRMVNMDHAVEEWMTPERRRWLDAVAGTYHPGLPQACRFPASLWLFAVLIAGDGERVLEILDTTVRTAEQAGYDWELAAVLQVRANALANRTLWAGDARRDADRSLEIFERLGDAWGAAEALSARGEAQERSGAYEAAAADYRRAIDRAAVLGARGQVALLRARLAGVLDELGRGAEAETILHEVIASGPESGREGPLAARLILALRLTRTGRTVEARSHLEVLLDDFRTETLAVFEGLAHGVLACVEVLDGEFDAALARCRRALELGSTPLSMMVAPQLSASTVLTAARALTGLGGEGRALRAARLIGMHDSLLPPGHFATSFERENRRLAEESTRAVLGGEAFEAARAEGGGLSVEEAAALL